MMRMMMSSFAVGMVDGELVPRNQNDSENLRKCIFNAKLSSRSRIKSHVVPC